MSRLEYCAEGEPKLLALRKITDPLTAYDQLCKLVGKERFEADYSAAQKKKPADREPSMWAIECWDKAHPDGDPALRVYGKSCARYIGRASDQNGKPCGCVLCDIARELGLLEAVAARESDRKQPAHR